MTDSSEGLGDVLGTPERECGFREDGGVYLVVDLAPPGEGYPASHFLVCPPQVVDKDDLGLSNVGVKLIERVQECWACKGGGANLGTVEILDALGRKVGMSYADEPVGDPCWRCNAEGRITVTHVYDIVGQDNYPNVLDFYEELKRLGASRKCELSTPEEYARLTAESRLFLLHPRAHVTNRGDYFSEMSEFARGNYYCIHEKPEHQPFALALGSCESVEELGDGVEREPMCTGLWRFDLDPGTAELLEGEQETRPGWSKRTLKSGAYYGHVRPEGVKPDYELSIFMSLPISRFELVDPERKHVAKRTKLSLSNLEVRVTEE